MVATATAVIVPASRIHLPALDGLRGFAILLVLFHHSWIDLPAVTLPDLAVLRLARTGWVGVDLFFVLSGFLITGILLDTKESVYYFRNFYVRRVLRIFPLYYAFLVFLFWIAPRVGLVSPEEASLLARNQPWYWSYTVNVLIARDGWLAAPWHTAHLWSLAVEEQFYLFWPVLVFILRRRQLAWLTGFVVVGSLALRILLYRQHFSPIGIHLLTPMRLDTLAMGAWLAIRAREPAGLTPLMRRARPALVAAGTILVALFLLGPFSPEGPLMQMFGYSAIVILAGGLLLGAVVDRPGSLANTIWRLPVMRFFGRYSYCIYLVHYPIILLLTRHVSFFGRLPAVGGALWPAGLLFMTVVIAGSVGIALLSWYGLESPFLRLKTRFRD